MISAVVLTKNEEKNIGRCIKSLLWCDEILIVDDFSKDKTLEIIKNLKIKIKNYNLNLKIIKRHLDHDFSAQRNYGLEKAKEEWILFVDADEVISEALASEIKYQVSSIKYQVSGYYLKRKDYFLGKWLRYGETGNIRLLRLAKREAGRWKGRVHEVWEIKGDIGNFKEPLLHYSHPTVSEFLAKINNYTDIVAQYWLEQGRRVGFWEIIFYPKLKFFQNYFLKLGFLDGIPGLIMALMMSFHSFLARAKLLIIYMRMDANQKRHANVRG